MKSASTKQYNNTSTSVYQVDWANAASGKRVSATKRRVRFRFGFANSEALNRGLSGTACRGEEHDVGIVWSLTSGKRSVTFDGKEVHSSKGRRGDSKFETSWAFHGDHILKIVANASPPLKPKPGFRQFDLLLDGMSFFHMPRIFEIGAPQRLHGFAVATFPQAHANVSSYPSSSPSAEGYQYPDTVVQSMEGEYPVQSYPLMTLTPAKRSTPEINNEKVTSVEMPPAPPRDVLSEPLACLQTSDQVTIPPNSSTWTYADEFTPSLPVKTFQDISTEILSANCEPPTAAPVPPLLANESQTYETSLPNAASFHFSPHGSVLCTETIQPPSPYPGAFVSPENSSASEFSYGEFNPASSMETLSAPRPISVTYAPTMMKPLDIDELNRATGPELGGAMEAVSSLVNLDNIKETKETPEQVKVRKRREVELQALKKSVPKPPVSTTWQVGQNTSLADLTKFKTTSNVPAKEIMNAHHPFEPTAAQAGMLVVHGQHPPTTSFHGGIPAASGFGADVTMYHRQGHAPHRGY